MTAAAGPISKARENFRTALAGCDAFQTWSGVSTAAQALNRIYYTSLPKPESGGVHTRDELRRLRPYALVWTMGHRRQRDAARDFAEGGWLGVRFMQDVPEEIKEQPDEIDMRFENALGQILADLEEESADGVFDIGSMVIDGGTRRAHPDEIEKLGDYVHQVVVVGWGNVAGFDMAREE